MSRLPRWPVGLVVAVAMVVAVVAPLAAQGGKLRHTCPPCLAIANTLIRADIAPNGAWVMGTTGGDPDTASDDDKSLLYGFSPGNDSQIGSSFTTVRIVGPRGITDAIHTDPARQAHQAANRVTSTWRWDSPYRVEVTQTLQIQPNPFSGRMDIVGIRYAVANRDSTTLDIGVRALLDIQLGTEDGAPYFIPGLGTVATEHDFRGADVPAYWLAFESLVYDPRRLRSTGVLRGPDVTTPDRFIIAWWRRLQFSRWDYTIDPTTVITHDSAVALYWNPQPLAPEGVRVVETAYGLAANRGGSAFVSAPVKAACGETFSVAIFVNNFDSAALTGGSATLQLPPGMTVAVGEPMTKPIADIAPGGTGSAAWQVRVGAGVQGPRTVAVTARFDNQREFTATADIDVDCVPPTSTPTPSPTATPSPPTPTPTLPTPTSETPPAAACKFILSRVPPAAISAALADPQHVRGWQEPLNPGLPPGPNNPLRTRLSLQNIGVPYHPLHNPLVFKIGCP